LVIDDQLHPENNGKVGVMDISKTLKNKIQGVDTPPNYYDLAAGYNFNIVVSIAQSRDKQSYYPDYSNSGYEQTPTGIDANYVFGKMNELQITDFAGWARKLNDAIAKKAQGAQAGYGNPQTQGQVAPQATTPVAAYTPGQPVATPVAPATAPVGAAPVATPVATPPAPQNGTPWEAAPTAPINPAAPAPAAPEMGDFDAVFGTPNG
jgi:hypothetical protein